MSIDVIFSGESVSYGLICELAFLDLAHMMKISFVIFNPVLPVDIVNWEGQKQMICFLSCPIWLQTSLIKFCLKILLVNIHLSLL